MECSWPRRLNVQPGRGCPLLLRRAGQPGEGSLGSPLREGLAVSAEPCQRHDDTARGIRWSLQKWRGRRNYSEVTEREMPGGGRSGGRPALREPARLSPALQAHARQPGTRRGAEKQSQGQPALPAAHGKQGCVSVTSPGGSRSLPRAPQGSSGSAPSFWLHKAQARSHGPPLEEGQATDLAGRMQQEILAGRLPLPSKKSSVPVSPLCSPLLRGCFLSVATSSWEGGWPWQGSDRWPKDIARQQKTRSRAAAHARGTSGCQNDPQRGHAGVRNPTKHLLREENPAGESRAKLLSNGTGACRGEAGVIQHPVHAVGAGNSCVG